MKEKRAEEEDDEEEEEEEGPERGKPKGKWHLGVILSQTKQKQTETKPKHLPQNKQVIGKQQQQQ